MRRTEVQRIIQKPYLNPRETARILEQPIRSVYYWLTIGRLPGCKLGGVWIVSTRLLLEMVRRGVEKANKMKTYEHQIDRRMREKHLVQLASPSPRRKKIDGAN